MYDAKYKYFIILCPLQLMNGPCTAKITTNTSIWMSPTSSVSSHLWDPEVHPSCFKNSSKSVVRFRQQVQNLYLKTVDLSTNGLRLSQSLWTLGFILLKFNPSLPRSNYHSPLFPPYISYHYICESLMLNQTIFPHWYFSFFLSPVLLDTVLTFWKWNYSLGIQEGERASWVQVRRDRK